MRTSITMQNTRKFSNKQINKSGDFLAKNNIYPIDELALDNHLEIFNYWRSLHSYVMNVLYINIKRRVDYLYPSKAILAQRLKRAPSILSKLKRFEKMKFSRMQDIAGIRIIVNKTSDIYKMRENIKTKFPHKLCYEKNYINSPKDDGYRCLHMVFETRNLTNPQYNGLNVELQIRTKLQHQWATAVEIIGLHKNTSYKSGLGDEEIREFLCLCSSLLATVEGTPIDQKYHGKSTQDLCKQLKEMDKKIKILDYLKGLTTAINYQNKNLKKGNIYLILLKLDERKLSLKSFNNPQKAESDYASIEKLIAKENKDWDVVLISLNNINFLKKAYPNYYLDSHEFTKRIENLMEMHCA